MRGSVLRNSLGVISLVCMLVIALAVTGENSYAAGPSVTTHSEQEIANYIKNNNIDLNEAVSFSTMPVKNSQQGQLSTASENSALRTLNAVRYIAGLNEVSLDSTYGRKAQAGAFVNWCIGRLTHTPKADGFSKPSGMSDTMWNEGNEGAGSSNIASGRENLNTTVVNGWMEDADSSNIARVGHRMWCLNPAMGKTGFGATTGSSYVDKYYAMWSKDGSASGSQTNVIWPAQKMPVEFFGSNYPWSLATGNTSITSGSNVNVTLTRRSSSPSGAGTWTFSGSNSYDTSSTLYFNFQSNSSPYRGQRGAYIVFRPDNITEYKPGDIFDVTITGLGSETISYTVEFFSGYPVESIAFAENEYRLEYNSVTKRPVVQPASASGYEVTYNSSNTSVATVDDNGTVTRVAPGTTTITATIAGRFTADGNPKSASYTLKVPKPITSDDIEIIQGSQTEYTGSVVDPFILKDGTKTLVKGVDYILTDFYDDPLNPIEPGTYQAFFNGMGDYCDYTRQSKPFVLTKKTITSDMITLTPSTFTYNGSVQKPAVTVKHGDLTLTEGTDYTVTIPESSEQGTYTVRVSAASTSTHYRSSATAEYEITRTIKEITSDMISVSSPQIYTGEAIRPQVTVKDGSTTLVNNNDYTLDYFDNTDAGTARVRVTGKGNYGSMAEKTFTISPRPLASDMITLSPESFPYNGSTQKPGVTVKYNGKTLNSETDYTVNNPGGKDRGTYTVTVTAAAGSNFSGSATKTFTIGKASLNGAMVSAAQSSYVYDGNEKKPAVTVKVGGVTLAASDYTVSYDNNINAGTATIRVTATDSGNYSGSAQGTFTILKQSISDDTKITIGSIAALTYNGQQHKPEPTVKHGSKTLSKGSDYELRYGENKNSGNGTITITGKGNYSEARTATFTIVPRPLASDMITLSPESFPYNGSTQKPGVTVKYNGKTLSSGTDYTVNNPGGRDRGTYTVTVAAVAGSNFSGSASATYSIGKSSLNGAVVSAAQDPFVYNGSEHQPAVTVKVGGVTLAASDYTVSYDNNVNAGTATIRVTATDSGNYSGSAQGTFTISKQSISDDTKITIGSIAALTYNGHQHKPEPTVKHGSTTLKKGSDYELSYGENTNSGTGTITITGKGNYSEARTATFVINAKAINDSSVSVDPIADQDLITGKTEYTPAVTVRDGGDILAKDTDYSVTYSDNTGAGTAEVTITGKGNYTASRKANFNIVIPADPEKAEARNALDEKLTEMKLVETGEYSPEDRAALENAITAAETLLAKPYEDVTKDEYQSALQAMIDAKNTADVNLEERKRQEQQQNQPQPQPQPTAGPSVAPDRLGPDTPDYLKPDAAAVEQTIMNQRGDGEPKGSTYSLIQLKSSKQAAKSTTLKWKRVSGATTYVVYGNKCGKANRFQKLAVTGATSFKHTGLKKGTYYKYVVVAVKGDRATAISKVVHVATAGNKKAANPKSVTATVLKKSKATIKRGKTVKIKAKQNGKNIKKHRTLRYESANPAVATVSSKGTVRGVKAGKTKIYVYAQNGVAKALTITVK